MLTGGRLRAFANDLRVGPLQAGLSISAAMISLARSVLPWSLGAMVSVDPKRGAELEQLARRAGWLHRLETVRACLQAEVVERIRELGSRIE